MCLQLAMKHQKEMEQLEKNQREQLEKLEKFNEQVQHLKRKEIWTLQQEYSLLISCLEEMTKENCVPSNSTSADCCSLYQVQKYPTTTFITQTSCIKQKHFSVYVPLCSASFLSVNETQSWRLEQFSGWFVPQITAAVCIICAVNCN